MFLTGVKGSLAKFGLLNCSPVSLCFKVKTSAPPSGGFVKHVRLYNAFCKRRVPTVPICSSEMHYKLLWPFLDMGFNDRNHPGVFRKFIRTSRSVTAYYDVLEITPQATQAQVKQSFYRLSKLYHPDINKTSEAKFKYTAIVEAYETLGNKRHRKLYDAGLGNHSPHGSHMHEDDLRTYRPEGGFKKRNQAPPTGRSKVYNYDEFYRMHYDAAFRRSKDIREDRRNEFSRKLRSQGGDDAKHLFGLGFLLSILAFMSTFYKRR